MLNAMVARWWELLWYSRSQKVPRQLNTLWGQSEIAESLSNDFPGLGTSLVRASKCRVWRIERYSRAGPSSSPSGLRGDGRPPKTPATGGIAGRIGTP